MSSEKSTDGDLVEQFKNDYEFPDYLKNVSKRTKISVCVEFKENYTLGKHPLTTLLEKGWFVSCEFNGKFVFTKFEVEQREVEKTITETKTVATVAEK